MPILRFDARMRVCKRTRAGLNKYPRSFHFYGTAVRILQPRHFAAWNFAGRGTGPDTDLRQYRAIASLSRHINVIVSIFSLFRAELSCEVNYNS